MTTPSRSRARPFVRELAILVAFAGVTMVGRASLADHYRVPTGSMLPTVELDDHIVVNKAAYGLRVPLTNTYVVHAHGPDVGDVVVLDSPEESKVLLKRVVGIPGATVEVRGGRVTLDGKLAPLEQRADGTYEQLGGVLHPVRLTEHGGPDFGPMVIPEDRYLVMGDNRGESNDGRSFGLVSRDAILGRAVGVAWRSGPTWDGL
jgi:signal peptidase I